MPYHGAATKHRLRQRRWRWLRRVLVQPHLFALLLAVLRQQLVRRQDVDHLQRPGVVPRPSPICRLLIAQIQLSSLGRRSELARRSLQVGWPHQVNEGNFMCTFRYSKFLLQPVQRMQHLGGLLRVRLVDLDLRRGGGAAAISEPRASVRDRCLVLPWQALPVATFRYQCLNFSAENQDQAIARHTCAKHRLPIEVISLLDTLGKGPRHRHAHGVVDHKKLLIFKRHVVQTLGARERLPIQ
mmetsp:Transcript_9458/g.23581  ORF Transcript_9458/g.23581 Transcript_9458/m.23581 type:complete len:241 (-) Transcript_9458:182-904(-)